MGTEDAAKCFEWNELVEVLCIREAERMDEAERKDILKRVNSLAARYGREYVVRKIALLSSH